MPVTFLAGPCCLKVQRDRNMPQRVDSTDSTGHAAACPPCCSAQLPLPNGLASVARDPHAPSCMPGLPICLLYAGQDAAKAYEYFSRALEQAEAALAAHQQRAQHQDAAFDSLAAAERDAAVFMGRLYLEALQEQRSSALTWLGRWGAGCGDGRLQGLGERV